ncbi:MAG: hypothetical protein EBU97_00485, partial [Rhodobacteraceae bacterium]|nr:hypothetical protein [Paracoccaceae bacterium]
GLPAGLLSVIAHWETRGSYSIATGPAGGRGIFQLTMHPHISGYRSRVWILDELIRHARSLGQGWGKGGGVCGHLFDLAHARPACKPREPCPWVHFALIARETAMEPFPC